MQILLLSLFLSGREDYITLGTKVDEGEVTRPILLLLAVIADRFVFNIASRSKDENAETKELGR